MAKKKEAVIEKETAAEVQAEKKRSGGSKVFTILGIVLCVLLAPILIINVTMIVKSYVRPKTEYPNFMGYSVMIVLSESMEDSVMKGDLIFIKQVDAKEIKGESAAGAQDGDIITFFDPDSKNTYKGYPGVLTHRCVKNDKASKTFITKGDNNIDTDPTPCPQKNLIGRYIGRIPGAGTLAEKMSTPVGMIICVAVPIILLVAYDLIMKKRYDKSKKKDTDALLAELEALRAQQAANEAAAEAKADAADSEAAEAAPAQAKPEAEAEKKPDPEAEEPEQEPEEAPAEQEET